MASMPETSEVRTDTRIERTSFELIRQDDKLQRRCSLNLQACYEYADALRDGADLKPLLVVWDGTVYWIYDGAHRYKAFQELRSWRRSGYFRGEKVAYDATLDLDTVQVAITDGTWADAERLSFSVNRDHGLRYNSNDKQKIVREALENEERRRWSDRELGRFCGVDHKTIALAKKALGLSGETPQIRRGEQVYSMNTAAIAQSNVIRSATPASNDGAKCRSEYERDVCRKRGYDPDAPTSEQLIEVRNWIGETAPECAAQWEKDAARFRPGARPEKTAKSDKTIETLKAAEKPAETPDVQIKMAENSQQPGTVTTGKEVSNETASGSGYFADRADSGEWFLVPVEKWPEWDEWADLTCDDVRSKTPPPWALPLGRGVRPKIRILTFVLGDAEP